MQRLHGTVEIDIEQMRARRLELGMTQEALAKRTGLALRTICSLEQGVTKRPESMTRKAIEKALGVDLTPPQKKEGGG